MESMLQRSPRVGGRVTKHSKQAKVCVTPPMLAHGYDSCVCVCVGVQLEMEQRLDKVLKEIGSVKMTLRSHHAFHK